MGEYTDHGQSGSSVAAPARAALAPAPGKHTRVEQAVSGAAAVQRKRGGLGALGLAARTISTGDVVSEVITPSGPLRLVYRLDTLGTLELMALFPFPAIVDLSEAVAAANLRLRVARLDFDAPARRVFLRAFLPLAWAGDPAPTIRFLTTAVLASADLLYPALAASCAGTVDRSAIVRTLDATRERVDEIFREPAVLPRAR
jgi:hypothetical protein